MRDVLANPQIQWSGAGLSANPNITMTDVLAFPQIQWDGNQYVFLFHHH